MCYLHHFCVYLNILCFLLAYHDTVMQMEVDEDDKLLISRLKESMLNVLE